MPKYRKKPVVVEAFQMTRERRWDNSEWPAWLNVAWNRRGEGGVWPDPSEPDAEGHDSSAPLVIGTKEGVMRIPWYSFIIQGVQGEIYACKPDIFDATYELVEEG